VLAVYVRARVLVAAPTEQEQHVANQALSA